MIQILDKIFHLTNGDFSYSFYVKEGKLYHSYFGKALTVSEEIATQSVLGRGLLINCGRDAAQFEMPESGRGDFRVPAAVVRSEKTISADFTYCGYEILPTKPNFGMPSLRDGGETLKITLKDDVLNAEMYLYYTVFENGLARRSEIKNLGKSVLYLDKLSSACVEFPKGRYDLIGLNGRWGRECNIVRAAATCGVKTFSSVRGVTSHQHNPFVTVAEYSAGEENGEVFGLNLIYSGNFEIECESDEKSQLRVNIGAKIMHGGIALGKGEIFSSPEAVIVYSDCGLGGMSRKFHRLYRKNLINPAFADKIRPVVVNSWESCYFDFNEDKLLKFIDGAKGLGIDTVVLDDGWFGRRDNDTSSLGDWFIDKNKLPHGLDPLISRCKKHSLKFGIWFEPEAVNPDSEMYKAHPDWALKTDGREGIRMRNQFTLDFSRAEVVDSVFKMMSEILSSYDISYVKWDMNRPLSDVVSAEKYLGFVKGVYSLYEKLTKAFPDVLIEGCSSGGGRFDPAMLYYSPMIWTSDDTDAFERAHVQYGASLCYPLQTLSNHVSVCPNHQTGRTLSFHTRGAIASLGCLGYELNVAEISEEERKQIAEQTALYRKDAEVILKGDLYRLISPFENGVFCEEVVSEDKSKAYVVFMRGLNVCNMPLERVRLKGLDATAMYYVKEKNVKCTGADLMYGGLCLEVYGEDFGAEILHIERTEN